MGSLGVKWIEIISEDCLMIRQLEPSDCQGIQELLDELGYPCQLKEMEERLNHILTDAEFHSFVYLTGKQVSGFICGHKFYYFPTVRVDLRVQALVDTSQFRKRGIGKALLTHIEKVAQKLGCGKVELTCNKSRLETLQFYRKQFFEEPGVKFEKKCD